MEFWPSVHIRKMHRYLWVALGLFFAGAVAGVLFAQDLAGLLVPMFKDVRHEASILHAATRWQMMWALYANNVRASLFMIVGGLIFGILPAFNVFANGALFGYTLLLVTEEAHANPFLVFIAGLLPHGIFEVPAYLLAGAMGLRLGVLVTRTVAAKAVRADWQAAVRDVPVVVTWVVILLLVAAWIESHVTPVLLSMVFHGATI